MSETENVPGWRQYARKFYEAAREQRTLTLTPDTLASVAGWLTELARLVSATPPEGEACVHQWAVSTTPSPIAPSLPASVCTKCGVLWHNAHPPRARVTEAMVWAAMRAAEWDHAYNRTKAGKIADIITAALAGRRGA